MASTDRAKPYERAIHGSSRTRTITAAASAGNARPGRPSANPRTATAPIVPARSTLGSGWTSMTKPTSATPQSAARAPGRSRAVNARTEPRMMATWAPDTAVMWVSEAERIAASRSAETLEVSPIAIPGTRAATSGGRSAVALISPARSSATAPATGGISRAGAGSPSAIIRATTSSPGPLGRSRPTARTGAPTSSSPQAADPSTRTGARTRTLTPRPVAVRTSTRTRTRPASPSHRESHGAGSPRTTPSTRTVAEPRTRSPHAPAPRA